MVIVFGQGFDSPQLHRKKRMRNCILFFILFVYGPGVPIFYDRSLRRTLVLLGSISATGSQAYKHNPAQTFNLPIVSLYKLLNQKKDVLHTRYFPLRFNEI